MRVRNRSLMSCCKSNFLFLCFHFIFCTSLIFLQWIQTLMVKIFQDSFFSIFSYMRFLSYLSRPLLIQVHENQPIPQYFFHSRRTKHLILMNSKVIPIMSLSYLSIMKCQFKVCQNPVQDAALETHTLSTYFLISVPSPPNSLTPS